MAVNLPGVGPLAAHWREALDTELTTAAGTGLVVDCRSSTYVAAWTPSGDVARRWVQIRVPGATHMAKHTRGLVARAICDLGLDPRRPEGLATGLAERFDVVLDAVGNLYVDGLSTGDIGDTVLADRTVLGEGGFIAATVVVALAAGLGWGGWQLGGRHALCDSLWDPPGTVDTRWDLPANGGARLSPRAQVCNSRVSLCI